MATVKAFKAMRYTARAGPLERLVAPPYDVIGAAERAELASRSPYNIVHLILPEGSPDPSDPQSRYTRAKTLLDSWLSSGILKVEDRPSMTVIEESFQLGGVRRTRVGVEFALRLERYGDGEVFPHEGTLTAPRADRLALFRATRTNLSPVFVLVPDASGGLKNTLAAMTSRPPDCELEGPDDARRRIWIVYNSNLTAAVEKELASRPVVIADGHHRYETALTYRDELAEAGCELAEAAYVLCHAVTIEDPGLAVLPTHRVLRPGIGPGPEEFLRRLAERFDLTAISQEEALSFANLPPTEGEPQAFVVVMGHRPSFHLARLRDRSAFAERAAGRSMAWKALDVACLHVLVLEEIFGIDMEATSAGGCISYTHDAKAATAAVQHEGGIAFLLRPVPPRAVFEVATSGERMPQKSTFFYPKVAAGFAMRLLDR